MSRGRVPEIRFSTFSNKWERIDLKSISKLITKGTTPKDKSNQGTINYIKVENIDSASGKITINHKITAIEHENYLKRSKLKEGDLLFSIAGTLGRTAVITQNMLPANTNQALAIIRLEKGNIDFITTFLNGKAIKDFIKKNPTTGAQPNLSLKQVGNLKIEFPHIDEQSKIGNFFRKIDENIYHNQHALSLLKQRKKAFLQKMIPSKGESVPEIRFSGFSDNWETVSINDIFKVTRGKVLAVNKVNENQSDEFKYPVYSSQTKNQGLLGYYTDYLYDTAITWTTDGANAGTVNFREGKFYSTNVNGVLLSDEGYANKVVAEILNKIAWKYVSKVGNPKLMNNIMSEIKISIPSLEEQLIIGNFFKELDNSIILQEEKLESLKQMKKAFLQKMFV